MTSLLRAHTDTHVQQVSGSKKKKKNKNENIRDQKNVFFFSTTEDGEVKLPDFQTETVQTQSTRVRIQPGFLSCQANSISDDIFCLVGEKPRLDWSP